MTLLVIQVLQLLYMPVNSWGISRIWKYREFSIMTCASYIYYPSASGRLGYCYSRWCLAVHFRFWLSIMVTSFCMPPLWQPPVTDRSVCNFCQTLYVCCLWKQLEMKCYFKNYNNFLKWSASVFRRLPTWHISLFRPAPLVLGNRAVIKFWTFMRFWHVVKRYYANYVPSKSLERLLKMILMELYHACMVEVKTRARSQLY